MFHVMNAIPHSGFLEAHACACWSLLVRISCLYETFLAS